MSGPTKPKDANSLETDTQVFVLRLWLEEAEEEGQHTWRGHITHVFSGKRRYLKKLENTVDFIVPYLRAMDVKEADLSSSSKQPDG